VPETCAVYCGLGLHTCPPLAAAINMPLSEMCTQPILDSVNRFRIAPTVSCLHHFVNSRWLAVGSKALDHCCLLKNVHIHVLKWPMTPFASLEQD
jgi:hypothetical protein